MREILDFFKNCFTKLGFGESELKTSPMKEIIDVFKRTIEDKMLSINEKRAVQKMLLEKKLSQTEIVSLRNKLFEIASTKLSGNESAKVLEWLRESVAVVNDFVSTPTNVVSGGTNSTTRNESYFSPGTACLDAIVRELQTAISSVDVCVFTISDNRITIAIKQCHQRGVKVRIITDDEKTKDVGSDIEELAKSGIAVKTDNSPNFMHHKFAIVDRKVVITGSYNWTRAAEQYNYENILLTDDKKAVAPFSKEFERLWLEMRKF